MDEDQILQFLNCMAMDIMINTNGWLYEHVKGKHTSLVNSCIAFGVGAPSDMVSTLLEQAGAWAVEQAISSFSFLGVGTSSRSLSLRWTHNGEQGRHFSEDGTSVCSSMSTVEESEELPAQASSFSTYGYKDKTDNDKLKRVIPNYFVYCIYSYLTFLPLF